MKEKIPAHAFVSFCALICSCSAEGDTNLNSAEISFPEFNFADWNIQDIESLDPLQSTFVSFQNYLFEPLVRLNLRTGTISMQAAESYEVSEDGRTYRFTIRDGATWHDGRAVQAADFRDGFRRMMASDKCNNYFASLGFANGWEIIRGEKPLDSLGVEAPDARHLVVRLTEPSDSFIRALGIYCFFPVRRDVVEKHGEKYGQEPGRFVGNGPYRLKEWSKGASALFERNPHYWNAADITTGRIRFGTLASFGCSDSEALCYKEGRLSMASLYRTGDYEQAVALGLPVQSDQAPTSTSWTRTIDVNMREGALFSDSRLRRALTIGVDRRAVARSMDLGGGVGFPFFGVVTDGMPGVGAGSTFRQEHPLPQIGARVAEARALIADYLAEKRLGALPPVRMVLHADWKGHADPVVSEVSAALGTSVEPVYVRGDEFFEKLEKGEGDLMWSGQVPSDLDPASYLDMYRSTEMLWNYSGFRDAAFDEIANRAHAARTLEERHRLAAEGEAMLLAQNVTIPLYIDKGYWVAEFQGEEPFPLGAGFDFSRVKRLRK